MKIPSSGKFRCLILLLCFTTVPSLAQDPAPYKLVQEEGIWVEQFDSTSTGENLYTANNLLYKEGSRFTYRYFYLDKQGRKYLQKVAPKAHWDREKAWNLIPLSEKDSLTNDRLQLVVESDHQGLPPGTRGFNHTPIRYEYFAPAGQLHFLERKSLVENSVNIWIEPPTGRLFRILALNPYPFIQAPYAVGTSWEWEHTIPAFWGDARWKEWQQPLSSHYQYRISREETLATPFGPLSCLLIEAEAKSTLGSTFLLAWFHPGHGFVKLLYTNIDGSQLLLELVKPAE